MPYCGFRFGTSASRSLLRSWLRASMSAGWRGSARQVRRNFRHRTTGFFFTVVPPHTGRLDFFSQLSAEGSNPGVTTGLKPLAKKACCSPPPTRGLEFFSWEESHLGRRRLGRLEAPMPGRFAETVGLDDSFVFFSWEESRPSARQGSDSGQARQGG